MKKYIITVVFTLTAIVTLHAQEHLQLWYERPAAHWNSALPLGNGRIGAMVYGSPVDEEFQLNEETISKGSPYRNDNALALSRLNDIRNLIFSEHNDSAQQLAEQAIIATKEVGKGAAYQPAGSLRIHFADHQVYTRYRRSLDIGNALSTVTYRVGDTDFRQEAFTSFTDQLLIIRYTASKRGKLSFSASLTHPDAAVVVRTLSANTIQLEGVTGQAAERVPGKVKFIVNAQIVNKGGRVVRSGNALKVDKADEVLIYVAMATNFVNYHDISASPSARIAQYMSHAGRPYEEALADHIAFYHRQFNRVSLFLGEDRYGHLPTDERIRRFSVSNDNYLAALYFQFGRYLLISCSQPDGQPANLQGIWSNKLNPAWLCRYTVNINTEMNYWLAEVCNLSEMHEPLIRMVNELSQTGAITARTMYGCRGWVAHHNTDLWRMSGAVDYAWSGDWPMSGAWLCQHLWNRYLYNGDREYLRSVYPCLRGAAEFFVDYLVTDPRNGYQVVCPSVSPENAPRARHRQSLFAGNTMDNQLVFSLFACTAEAARLLGVDALFADTLHQLGSKLMPLRIGQYGQLQEWAEDWDHPQDHHRHVSHLWGFYPGTVISPLRTPEAFEAVKTSLAHRGDPSTGWSMGWKVCLWARCQDGNHAYQLIKNQLSLVPDTIEKGQAGGTYANMFDAHPPFQIDGNFGCTAGIAEMLVQSHDGFVSLLPALPAMWPEGEVSGLRTIGGFVIEKMQWRNHRLASVRIRSTIGGNLRIVSAVPLSMNGQRPATASGRNPNELFATFTMPVTRLAGGEYVAVDQQAAEGAVKGKYVYDIPTSPHQEISLSYTVF